MGVITNTDEMASPIAPARMFHALFLDAHNLMPKIMSQVVKSVEIVSGENGIPGSVQQINFTEAVPFKYAKHRLDALDKQNMVCKYSVIEGDALGDKLESIAFEVKFEAAGNGGSICKTTSKHYTKGDAVIPHEEIMEGKEKSMGMYKAVEAYLTENPAAYA